MLQQRAREADRRGGPPNEQSRNSPWCMLGAFIFIILLGFPIAFTLMAMGVMFGYYAYYVPGQEFFDNRVFYLLSQNTFSIMNNDVLTAVPLFLFMGYMIERSNILDRLFHSLQVALQGDPGLDGGGGARHLRALRDRHRHRGRGGDADGPARVPGDAQGGLRPEALGGRDLRRRHARHPHPALDHADRLRRDVGGLGGEALRGGDDPRLPARRPVHRLRDRARRRSTRSSRPSCPRRRPTSPGCKVVVMLLAGVLPARRADPVGARRDPLRAGHAERGGGRRRAGRHGARHRLPRVHLGAGSRRRCSSPRAPRRWCAGSSWARGPSRRSSPTSAARD